MENIVISKHVKITAMVGELVIMANVIVTLVSYLDIIYTYIKLSRLDIIGQSLPPGVRFDPLSRILSRPF